MPMPMHAPIAGLPGSGIRSFAVCTHHQRFVPMTSWQGGGTRDQIRQKEPVIKYTVYYVIFFTQRVDYLNSRW
jgi:hypothetical protein